MEIALFALGALAGLGGTWYLFRSFIALGLCPAPLKCPHHRDHYARIVNDAADLARTGRRPLR